MMLSPTLPDPIPLQPGTTTDELLAIINTHLENGARREELRILAPTYFEWGGLTHILRAGSTLLGIMVV